MPVDQVGQAAQAFAACIGQIEPLKEWNAAECRCHPIVIHNYHIPKNFKI